MLCRVGLYVRKKPILIVGCFMITNSIFEFAILFKTGSCSGWDC